MAHEHCCHAAGTTSVAQSIDELDFERGVWSSAMDGDVDKVRNYLTNRGNPDSMDSSGYTALHYAARNGKTLICKLLLDHHANVNAQTRSGSATPLQRAAYQGHTEVVQLLLDRGADVTMKDNDGKTALHKAAEGSKVNVCRLLIKNDGSLINVTDNKNRKPVDCLQNNSDAELKQLLS